ncbi:MAG: hypothetical protein GY828_05435 [Candidatus Gracilibacteria bacterium]|nr:hypothetical protein [Candidatus Gracilibacteria bacterium]
MGEKEKNTQIIGNAISAYFMIFVSGLFLFNKNNPLLNNQFVKKHTKSALMIHLGFFLTYVIFISYNFLSGISFFNFSLNVLIATSLCIILLGILLYGVFCAKNGDEFNLGEVIQVKNTKKIMSIGEKESTSNERDKLTIIFSYIPLIGFYQFPSYKENTLIQNGTRLNLFITIIFILLYSFGSQNLANLLGLSYILYVVFIGVTLFTTGSILQLRLHSLFAPENKFLTTQAFFLYLSDYFSGKEVHNFSVYLEKKEEEKKESLKKISQELENTPELKIPKFCMYIPFVNFVYLFLQKNPYSTHVRNGIVLSILFIISYLSVDYFAIDSGILYFFFIIILYALGYMKVEKIYTMPYIYIWYELFAYLFGKTKAVKEKYHVEKEVVLKVENKK